jgi:hypothetical protein
MTNPIDRIPVVLKELRDSFISLLIRKLWLLLLFFAAAFVILHFANSRDLIINYELK